MVQHSPGFVCHQWDLDQMCVGEELYARERLGAHDQ